MASRNNPEERIKRTEEAHRFIKYKERILDTFSTLLDEYEEDESSNSVVNPALHKQFKDFIRNLMSEFELSYRTANSDPSSEYADDDDVMFPDKNPPKKPKKTAGIYSDPYSFWGNVSITKRDNGSDEEGGGGEYI
jgi:hypothetical protein